MYKYQVVAGASVFSNAPGSIIAAKKHLHKLRQHYPNAEIERIFFIEPRNYRRYWRWRNGEWSTRNHYEPTKTDLQHWDKTP